MEKHFYKKKLGFVVLVLITGLLMTLISVINVSAASSGKYTPVEGIQVSVSGASNTTESNGVVTVTAKGSGGLGGLFSSSKTATVKIKNTGSNQATVGFMLVKTSVNSLTASAGTLTDTSFSAKLDAGAEVTLTLTTAKNSTENKIVLSNFSYSVIADRR